MSVGPKPWHEGQIPQIPLHSPAPDAPIDYSTLDQETLYKMFAHKITITDEELKRRESGPFFTYEEVKAKIQKLLEEKYPGEV